MNNLASHPKHKFVHAANGQRWKRESLIKDTRIEMALKTDKSTWKKCKHCGELFPKTNDFWVKNGKLVDGSQRYRTFCGKSPANNCYDLHGRKDERKRTRTNAEKMKTWRGHLTARKAGSWTADNILIERKIGAGHQLTEFEELLRNGVMSEVHPLTIEVLLDMLEKQNYRCAETGIEFPLEFPHLNNLSVDRKPGHEYHTPEGVQLVTQWYNKAVGAASREQRDILNENLKNMGSRQSERVGPDCKSGGIVPE